MSHPPRWEMEPNEILLDIRILAENGDVILRVLRTGLVVLTVRDVADEEQHATVQLTPAQAHAIGDVLLAVEAPESGD